MPEAMKAPNEGETAYEEWRASLVDTPEKRALYEEVAAEKELWLELVEARMAAGVTPEELARRMETTEAQVTRIERNGYGYPLKTLHRYVRALREGFTLTVKVRRRPRDEGREAFFARLRAAAEDANLPEQDADRLADKAVEAVRKSNA